MAKMIEIAIEVQDRAMVKKLKNLAESISDVHSTQWYGSIGEKGPLAVKIVPDIIIIDDLPGSTLVFERLRDLRLHFSEAALFVVSEEKDPEHIVEVMKRGVTEYLVLPIKKNTFVNAVEEVRTKLADEGKIEQGLVYSFVSSKGGLGSTVLAVNSAVALVNGKHKKAVAFFDNSFQSGDSSVLMDIVPETTILDLCKNMHRLDVALLRGVMVEHSSNVDFLSAPSSPEESEEVTKEDHRKILDLLTKMYDHVIIDCVSMHIDEIMLESFHRSEKIFVVMDLSIPAIRNAVRLGKIMQQFGVDNSKIYYVVNRFVKSSIDTLETAEKNLGKKIYWLFPNDFEDIVSSINEGVPLVQLHPHNVFSKNIIRFVEKIQGKVHDMDYRGARGAFGRSI